MKTKIDCGCEKNIFVCRAHCTDQKSLRPGWKVYPCVQNNGPDYWIVTDKAFKGTVLAQCDSEEKALRIARAVNCFPQMLDALKAVDPCDVKAIARVKVQNAILAAEDITC